MVAVMIGLFLAAFLTAGPANTQQSQVHPGKWVVDYAQAYCVLSRHGIGAEPGVAFRTRPFADEHDVLVYFARTGEKYVSARGLIFLETAQA